MKCNSKAEFCLSAIFILMPWTVNKSISWMINRHLAETNHSGFVSVRIKKLCNACGGLCIRVSWVYYRILRRDLFYVSM